MLAGAAACAAAFATLLVAVYWFGPARFADAAALDGFVALDVAGLDVLVDRVASLCDPVPFALLAASLVVIALATRGPRCAAAVALLVTVAPAASQVLKPLLGYERELPEHAIAWPIQAEAFPSGHATAAMSLALAALIVAPRAYRPLVALAGGAFALAVGFAVVTGGWHYPSDVVGGQLLATAWCLTLLAGLRAAAIRWPERGGMRLAARRALPQPLPAVTVAAAAIPAALAAAVAFEHADRLAAYAERHTSFVVVAAAISLTSATLLAAVTALSSRRG